MERLELSQSDSDDPLLGGEDAGPHGDPVESSPGEAPEEAEDPARGM